VHREGEHDAEENQSRHQRVQHGEIDETENPHRNSAEQIDALAADPI